MTIVVRSKEKKLEYYAVNAEVIGIAGGLTQISEERAYKIMKGDGYTLQIETSEKVPILNIVGIAKGAIQISLLCNNSDRTWITLKEDKNTKSITMQTAHVANEWFISTWRAVPMEVMQLMTLEFIAIKSYICSYQFGYRYDSKKTFKKLQAVATGWESGTEKHVEAYKDECKNYSGKRLIEKLCNDLLNGSVLILRSQGIPYGYRKIGAEEVSRRMRAEAVKCGYTN